MSHPAMEPQKQDALAAAAGSIRRLVDYVSASQELTDPDSVINQADPAEPVFVLRARDVVADITIDWWLWCARNRGVPEEKLVRAERQRQAVQLWLEKRLPAHGAAEPAPRVRTAGEERSDPDGVLRRAHPEEPVFVLVASDVTAVEVVEFWTFMAARAGVAEGKVGGALAVAKAMARWERKRLPGVRPRPFVDAESEEADAPVAEDEARAAPAGEESGWRHATVARIVCQICGHEEKIGEPPYTEELLSAIAEACKGPCPACGATEKEDPRTGRKVRPLTTRMGVG